MPTKGDIQYLNGIGFFEWDGASWLREGEKYTHDDMVIILRDNGQECFDTYYRCGCGELVPNDVFCIDCDLARDSIEGLS